MLVPQRLRSSVVFLGERTGVGVHWGGTAFFVSQPYTRWPDHSHVYLVTARHCVEGKTDLVARLNSPPHGPEGGTYLLDLPDGDEWLKHPAPAPGEDYVDVAAMKVPDLSVFGAWAAGYGWARMSMFFPESLLGDEPESGVGIGDEVVALGLLTVHYGEDRNEPVMRMGNLAMVPKEPVLVHYKGGPSRRMRLYLTELRSISGLSGSPVFVRHRTFPGDPEQAPMSLLGLMIGHWDDPDSNHMGFGKVVPAQLIAEVIDQEDEVKRRDAEERKKAEEEGTAVEDSGFEGTEYERFEKLARELANTPKPKDEKGAS